MKKSLRVLLVLTIVAFTLTSCYIPLPELNWSAFSSSDSKEKELDETDLFMQAIREKYAKTFDNELIHIGVPSISHGLLGGVRVSI